MNALSPPHSVDRQPLILVIDDEDATRYALTWALRKANYRVIEAATGRQGLDQLKNAPDLIVLDIMLPDMTGFEVCRIIKNDLATASIPVLHMSAAYLTSADKTQGLEMGADAYLIHPVESPELLATVRALLRIRASEAKANDAARLWQSTFDAIQDGVCLVDDFGFIQSQNRALIEIIAKHSGDMGLTLNELIPSLPLLHQCPLNVAEDVRIGERWYSFEVSAVETGGKVCTFRDITERRLAEIELINAKKLAEAANQSKSMFLANMSHEIRTPLGAMIGFAALLKEDGLPAPERVQFLETIMRNGENLTHLIDDILDLSKVEAEKMEFERVPVDVKALLGEVTLSLGIMAKAKGIELTSEWKANTASVIYSDPARVRQVLMNIVGNAVKFTSKGHVHVKALCKTPGKISFEVSDTGRGIAQADEISLFKPFSQGDSSTTRSYGGTGLGLILSKQLAKGLGGDVTLASSTVGEGSTFCIEIRGEAANIETKKAGSQVNELGSLKGLQILVADDSPDNRLLIRRILSRQGVVVSEVENGLEAVERAKDFDVVLMDIQMPVLDGYHATDRLRQGGYKGTIIALTAHAMKEERDRCLAIGCTEYLTKPIDVPQLLKALLRAIPS